MKRINDNDQTVQAHFVIPHWLLKELTALVPEPAYRNRLIIQWIRAYITSNGESDRLLAQSPTILKNIAYLEANDGPQDLIDENYSLLVERGSDEIKAEQIGGLFIV